MVKNDVKMKMDGLDLPSNRQFELVQRRKDGVKEKEKKKNCSIPVSVSVFVTLELPPQYYKIAAGMAHMFDFRNFDEYVSDLVINDLRTHRDGGEHLADMIDHIMPDVGE